MREFARVSKGPVHIYFAGGATAVLIGWRPTTIDVDLRVEPEEDELLREIPRIKEELQVNIEFASPLDFIPVAPDWRKRSLFIETQGAVSYYHFDFVAQALSKLERGHKQDLADLDEMLRSGLVSANEVADYFQLIEPELFRFPAIDAKGFRAAVETWAGS